MQIILKQSEKKHDTNKLHDALIKAGLNPWPVECTARESCFTFPDNADPAKIRGVIDAYVYHVPLPQPSTSDIIAALARMDLSAVSTLDQLKAQIAPVARAALNVIETGGQTPSQTP